ncbi:MAG: GatB/YqeY domain-containing protein [Actinomycetota bacterium]
MAEGSAPLAARLEEDMKAALRAGEKLRLGVIRRARAAVKNAEIDARGAGLSEEQVERVLRGMVKQHRESIEQFTAAGRADRAEEERAEMAVLEEYLPEQLDAAAVEEVVRAVIADMGATGPKDLGAVMREAMARLGGAADGKVVNAAARRLLEAG